MRITYPVCCGMDVHKNSIVATIATTGKDNITTYSVKTVSTMNADLLLLRDWLLENDCHDVCMESTGKYWHPVFNVLEDHAHVIVTHPKYVRAIKGKKTDRKDSMWIADLFKFDMVRSSFIPPKDFREMREIARYRSKLVGVRSAEKMRYQNCMTTSNIGLGSILTDPLGVTAQGIMGHLLSSDVLDEEACKALIKKSAKKKTALILESIKGCSIRGDQRFKLMESKSHQDYLDQMVLRCEYELFVRIQPYYRFVEHVASLTGFAELSAALLIAEIGVDMSVFDSEKHLTSWAGLTPANNESAGKKKSVRISKAGQFLKPLLVQCALAAIKDKKETYFAAKYQKLKARRGHKKAIIAIARMLLTCVYHMLKTGEDFHPSDYDEFKSPKQSHPYVLTDDDMIAQLAAHGYDVSALTKAG